MTEKEQRFLDDVKKMFPDVNQTTIDLIMFRVQDIKIEAKESGYKEGYASGYDSGKRQEKLNWLGWDTK